MSGRHGPGALLVIVVVVAIEMAVAAYYAATGFSTAGTASLAHMAMTTMAAWLGLVFALALLRQLAQRLGPRSLRWLGEPAFVLCLFVMGALQTLLWAFYVFHGYALSSDAVAFLLLNWQLLPQHLLQTAPGVAIALVLAAALYAMLMLWLVAAWSRLPAAGAAPGCAALLALALLSPFPASPYSPGGALLSLLKPDGTEGAATLLELSGLEPRHAAPAAAPATAPPAAGPVIVILVESLRHDLLEMEPSPIPFLKSLWQQSHGFSRAYAAASHSDYADLSVWYSRYPLRSLNRSWLAQRPPAGDESLFSVLRSAGFATAYISSQNEKWGNMIRWLDVPAVQYFYHSEDYRGSTWYNRDDSKGLARLIGGGIATAGKIEDSQTLRIAREWIRDNGSKPFVLGLNLQNSHFSYVIPDGGAEPFGPSELDFETVYASWPEEQAEAVRRRYLNAVYNLDRLLAGFADFLKAQGLWDSAVFAVLGDSGEAFYEHGYSNHSGPMYDEAVRTLLLVKAPQQRRGELHPHPVSHIDVVPAVLDLLGLPASPSFQGLSPFSVTAKRPIYMHSNAIVTQHGVVHWPWKFLETVYPQRREELFNLAADPGERRNVVAEQRAAARQLRGNLALWKLKQISYYRQPDYHQHYWPPKVGASPEPPAATTAAGAVAAPALSLSALE